MNRCQTIAEIDLHCYPNYSLAVGDVDGDGRLELISLNQNGNRLRAVDLDGRVVLEHHLRNNGNWGTILMTTCDIDGDGRDEIIAPHADIHGEAQLVAVSADGQHVATHAFDSYARDDYGVGVPLLARARPGSDQECFVCALPGGTVISLDHQLSERWRIDGLRRSFGHELYVGDLDGDGADEIAFCTVDRIGAAYSDNNRGDLVVLDDDGTLLLRRPVDDYCADSHFDDVALGDFRGRGEPEILTEKGFLIDLDGRIIWDVSDHLEHGQWIAHTPDPRGRGQRIFIAELWAQESRGALFSADGDKLADIADLPRTRLDPRAHPGWRVLPTRPHILRGSEESTPEIFLAEQGCSPTSHDCFADHALSLQAYILDLKGQLVEALPFTDAQIEGYWYNGEVHSCVADVDGDGRQEVVFPKQNGKVSILRG